MRETRADFSNCPLRSATRFCACPAADDPWWPEARPLSAQSKIPTHLRIQSMRETIVLQRGKITMTTPSEGAKLHAMDLEELAKRMRRNAVSWLVYLTDPDTGLQQPFLDQARALMENIWAVDFEDRLEELDRKYEEAFDEAERRILEAGKNVQGEAEAEALGVQLRNWYANSWYLAQLKSDRSRANAVDGAVAAHFQLGESFEALGM